MRRGPDSAAGAQPPKERSPMASDTTFGMPGADAFAQFWTDFMKRSASVGVAAAPPAPDVMTQMRKAFFDALAEHADRYMRSEAFLQAMKQSMDSTLAWQQQMNEFLHRSLAAAQMPSHTDTDHTVMLLRGMEDRIMARLDEMAERIERIEAAASGAPRGVKVRKE